MKVVLTFSCLASVLTLCYSEDVQKTGVKDPLTLYNENSTMAGRPGSRIVGGSIATLGLIPYQAAVIVTKSSVNYICGGSLIAPNWILTSASCIDGGSYFKVRLGSLSPSDGGQFFFTNMGYKHPAYNSTTLNFNLGLIKLYEDAVYNNYVQPITMADACVVPSTGLVSGWGSTTTDNGPSSSSLRYADLSMISSSQCSSIYGNTYITENILCTAGSTTQSTCNGDSGGPLVDTFTKELRGVISFISIRGCTAGDPAGYTKISNLRPWIRSTTGLSFL